MAIPQTEPPPQALQAPPPPLLLRHSASNRLFSAMAAPVCGWLASTHRAEPTSSTDGTQLQAAHWMTALTFSKPKSEMTSMTAEVGCVFSHIRIYKAAGLRRGALVRPLTPLYCTFSSSRIFLFLTKECSLLLQSKACRHQELYARRRHHSFPLLVSFSLLFYFI